MMAIYGTSMVFVCRSESSPKHHTTVVQIRIALHPDLRSHFRRWYRTTANYSKKLEDLGVLQIEQSIPLFYLIFSD
jgi:hypothetical protein